MEVSGLDTKEWRMGNQERVGLKSVECQIVADEHNQIAPGLSFLSLSDRVRIENSKESASSWSELGLYLMEGLGDETTELQGEGWENAVVVEVGRQRELEDS